MTKFPSFSNQKAWRNGEFPDGTNPLGTSKALFVEYMNSDIFDEDDYDTYSKAIAVLKGDRAAESKLIRGFTEGKDTSRARRRSEKTASVRERVRVREEEKKESTPRVRRRSRPSKVETVIVPHTKCGKRKGWYIEGSVYDTRSAAAEAVGVSSMTILRWCQGYTKPDGTEVLPKSDCWKVT